MNLLTLDTFGEVAAEDDELLLSYFLSTETISDLENDRKFLILGRKGAGKTAVVRYFSEGSDRDHSRVLNLRNYPWAVHAEVVDRGAEGVEAYVASWRYLIAVELASFVVTSAPDKHLDELESLKRFLSENYKSLTPSLPDIFRPERIKVEGVTLGPQILGNAIGSISLRRTKNDDKLGYELNSLTNSLLAACRVVTLALKMPRLFLHFDELDASLSEFDSKRKHLLIGLVIAARDLRRDFKKDSVAFSVLVYLRSDLWRALAFSDRNKVSQTQIANVEWDSDALLDMFERRTRTKLSSSWSDIVDKQLMRGSQPKWNHIVARTMNRPRDVIQFLNCTLAAVKKRAKAAASRSSRSEMVSSERASTVAEVLITNKDVVKARTDYSNYFKLELDDEIGPHWPQWDDAFRTLVALGTEVFDASDFESEYATQKSTGSSVEARQALELLHRFSVVGYESRSGYGGRGWVFQYDNPSAGWDSQAVRFKVHPGLKEVAKLREGRQPGHEVFEDDELDEQD